MLLGRVLRRQLVRVSVGTRVLVKRRRSEGAWKTETRPFAEYEPLCVYLECRASGMTEFSCLLLRSP